MNVWGNWIFSVGVSTVLKLTQNYEMCRARGDFPLVNQSRMVSFSRMDKKRCKRIIIVIKTKMCHQIYLGGRKYTRPS